MTKKILFILLASMSFLNAFCQPSYLKTFGKKESAAIIFLHGGPGYNAASFESTTAGKLSEKGYFVIVYDRRGEGRSEDKSAKFSFQQSFDDIIDIYKKYELNSAVLIGHGFGGHVATLFTEKYPDKVTSLLLVGTPLTFQQSFKTILRSSKEIYTSNKDTSNLKLLKEVEKLDTTSLIYASRCFDHAMINRFYSIANPTEEAKRLYEEFRNDTTNIKFVYRYSYDAPQYFLNNEKYTTINIKGNLEKLLIAKKKIFAIYGKNDGTNSTSDVEKVKSIIGEKNLKYFDACGYNAFIDQQSKFFESLETWLK